MSIIIISIFMRYSKSENRAVPENELIRNKLKKSNTEDNKTNTKESKTISLLYLNI